MSVPAPRERRLSLGPTVYHDEDDANMKRPPRVFYEEVTRERPRRSSSAHSQPAQIHHENVRHVPDVSNAQAPDVNTTKPAFVESIMEKLYADDEKPQYVEKPFSAEDDMSYIESGNPYRESYYRGRNGPAPRYAPPRNLNSSESPNLLWPKIRKAMRDPFSEFFGTFMLVLFGEG